MYCDGGDRILIRIKMHVKNPNQDKMSNKTQYENKITFSWLNRENVALEIEKKPIKETY